MSPVAATRTVMMPAVECWKARLDWHQVFLCFWAKSFFTHVKHKLWQQKLPHKLRLNVMCVRVKWSQQTVITLKAKEPKAARWAIVFQDSSHVQMKVHIRSAVFWPIQLLKHFAKREKAFVSMHNLSWRQASQHYYLTSFYEKHPTCKILSFTIPFRANVE